jgi:hypothetical protein
MRKIVVAAAAGILAASVIHNAYAESNELSAVERPPSAVTIFSAPARVDVGSESYPSFPSGNAVPIVAGEVLQPNGSEGIVQTANSLPPGFTTGTPVYEYAQSVQRYFAAQASRVMQARVARTGPHPPG